MAEYLTNTTDLTKVADAIRMKGGTADPLVYPDGFVMAIQAISSGGDAEFEITVDVGTAGMDVYTVAGDGFIDAEDLGDGTYLIVVPSPGTWAIWARNPEEGTSSSKIVEIPAAYSVQVHPEMVTVNFSVIYRTASSMTTLYAASDVSFMRRSTVYDFVKFMLESQDITAYPQLSDGAWLETTLEDGTVAKDLYGLTVASELSGSSSGTNAITFGNDYRVITDTSSGTAEVTKSGSKWEFELSIGGGNGIPSTPVDVSGQHMSTCKLDYASCNLTLVYKPVS